MILEQQGDPNISVIYVLVDNQYDEREEYHLDYIHQWYRTQYQHERFHLNERGILIYESKRGNRILVPKLLRARIM